MQCERLVRASQCTYGYVCTRAEHVDYLYKRYVKNDMRHALFLSILMYYMTLLKSFLFRLHHMYTITWIIALLLTPVH